MGTIHIVAKFMEHGVKNLFIREEIPVIVWSPQSELNLSTSTNVEPQKGWVRRAAFSQFIITCRNIRKIQRSSNRLEATKGKCNERSIPKFREDVDFPLTFTHYWLYLFCHLLENFPRIVLSHLLERLDFPNLVKIIKVHADPAEGW